VTCQSKTVKFQGSFAVVDASNVASPNKTIKDLDLSVTQVQSSECIEIPGNTIDYQIPFGLITVGRRIYLRTDYPVTVKFNQNTDIGFEWQGVGVVPSGATGISALYISTSASDTCVEFVVVG
jgi:hypothetical protein